MTDLAMECEPRMPALINGGVKDYAPFDNIDASRNRKILSQSSIGSL